MFFGKSKQDLKPIQQSERKVRSDKKIRVNPPLNQDTHDKLVKLSISCGVSKTHLAELFLDFCVNHVDVIEYFQRKYNPVGSERDNYRVIPIRINGKTKY